VLSPSQRACDYCFGRPIPSHPRALASRHRPSVPAIAVSRRPIPAPHSPLVTIPRMPRSTAVSMAFRPSTTFPCLLQLIQTSISLLDLGRQFVLSIRLVSLLGHGMRVSSVVSRVHFASVPSFRLGFDAFALICFNPSALVSVRSHLYLLVHTHPRRSLTTSTGSGKRPEGAIAHLCLSSLVRARLYSSTSMLTELDSRPPTTTPFLCRPSPGPAEKPDLSLSNHGVLGGHPPSTKLSPFHWSFNGT